ncbi:hypothetical protein T06_14556, partial [Trichinella sp. T6]
LSVRILCTSRPVSCLISVKAVLRHRRTSSLVFIK